MNVELIVDSTMDVPERVRSRLTVVPLTIHFGQEEFLDGVTMDRPRFYERLVESDVLPTTSQASPAAFDRELRRVRDSGSAAVVLTISSKPVSYTHLVLTPVSEAEVPSLPAATHTTAPFSSA